MQFLLIVSPALAQDFAVTTLSRHILTNEAVISLAKAGFDELFIVERIKTSRVRFDTTVAGLVALKDAGISEDLIRAMATEDRLRNPTPPELGSAPLQAAAPAMRTGFATSAVPAGIVQPPTVSVKRWWVFRWIRISP